MGIAAFRDSVLFVPRTPSGSVVAGDWGGVRWLYAFTGRDQLRLWMPDPTVEQPYLTVFGWRLLDVAVPAVGRPAGIVVDVAGDRPLLLPPVRGIVPDAAAVA